MLPIGASGSGVSRHAQQIQKAFNQLSEVSLKLATLKRINRGSDDPAGMMAAEELKREIATLDQASRVTEHNRSFAHVASSGLAQAADLLNKLEGNLVTAANDMLSPAERDGIQIEIEAQLDALDRIGASTEFAGKRVFDGQDRQVLVGPDPSNQATLSVPELTSDALGSVDGRLTELRSNVDPSTAIDIVQAARSQVLTAHAKLGAFERNSLNTASELFADTAINLSLALSEIEDADFAVESSNLVRSMILADTAVATARLAASAQWEKASLLDEVLRL